MLRYGVPTLHYTYLPGILTCYTMIPGPAAVRGECPDMSRGVAVAANPDCRLNRKRMLSAICQPGSLAALVVPRSADQKPLYFDIR